MIVEYVSRCSWSQGYCCTVSLHDKVLAVSLQFAVTSSSLRPFSRTLYRAALKVSSSLYVYACISYTGIKLFEYLIKNWFVMRHFMCQMIYDMCSSLTVADERVFILFAVTAEIFISPNTLLLHADLNYKRAMIPLDVFQFS